MPKSLSFPITHRGQGIEVVNLILIACLLTGYALLSKGFAYLGRPPFFIGDITLFVCLFLFLIRPNIKYIFTNNANIFILMYSIICASQTIPYLEKYSILSIRDSVIYIYSLFAIIIGSLMARQGRILTLVSYYESFSNIIIILSPLVILAMIARGQIADTQHVPLIFQKSGDLSVQLAGAAAFRLVGLNNRAKIRSSSLRRIVDIAFWCCWLVCATWASTTSRGGMLSMVIGLMIALFSGYGRRNALLAGGCIIAGIMILGAFQVSFKSHSNREISMDQLIANSLSIIGDTSAPVDSHVDIEGLRGTAAWRMRWWKRIIDDTLSTDHFWTGRGFGANIATQDGFQTSRYETLRSPHNIHMTVLARAGVPGLVAWLVLLASIGRGLWLQGRRMRHLGFQKWHALNTWILCYWTASTVNATFDVYLEGPQGGIWWWSIVGFAIAVITVEKQARPSPAPPAAITGVAAPGVAAG